MKRKIDKSEMLEGDFLKQFKTSEDFSSFMEQLYKRGVEQLLEGELDAHLGYEKHHSSSTKIAEMGIAIKRFGQNMEKILFQFQETEKAVLSQY